MDITTNEACSRITILESTFNGSVGARIDANRSNWALTARKANPGMLSMFEHRDRLPRRDLMPWSGEFVGKHLTALTMEWELSRDPRVEAEINEIISELARLQDPKGYLGPFPQGVRIAGKVSRIKPDSISESPVWDLWGHYHAMLGLLRWHGLTGNPRALSICHGMVEYVSGFFTERPISIVQIGATEMNMALAHLLLLLNKIERDESALRLARRIETEWQIPGEGDFVRLGVRGVGFFQMPKPRWEALHDVQAVAEFYFLTGESKYRVAFENIWRSISAGDRHNTGGFSSGEKAVGDPYATGAIETCCTVAWVALSVDMLRMTGDSRVADELELALFNAVLGAQHPSGRWWTYNTPMDGVRRASAHDIVFQSYQGSPELNCCSVNGPRSLLSLCEWGVMRQGEGVVLNYFGDSTISVRLEKGLRVELRQVTDYPASGLIRITVAPEVPSEFPLSVRVPSWSSQTEVRINTEVFSPKPGKYFHVTRRWTGTEEIILQLDMSPHFWPGERQKNGFLSVFSGPILLTYDQRFNSLDPADLPRVTLPVVLEVDKGKRGWPEPLLLARARFANGASLMLCDFATAGATGTWYNSWLPWEPDTPLAAPATPWQQWVAR
jgi:uncharacterized protein